MNNTEKISGLETTISISEYDPNFKFEVLAHPDASGLNACFNCGTCTAGCPIHEVFPEYNPRKLAKMVSLGMKKQVLTSPYIWYCATCHNCEQRCPQNVKFFSILNVLKNMAAKQGHAPSCWIQQTEQVAKTGIVFAIEEKWVEKRAELSLSPLALDGEKAKRIIELSGINEIKPKVNLDE